MILMWLDDVPGDCQIKGYEEWITCSSVSWSIEREFSESAKAGTLDVNLGVSDLPPIEVGKSMDRASADLMFAGAGKGKVSAKGKIHFIGTGDTDDPKKNLYLEFLLDNPIIAGWSISGSDDDRPEETVNLWYWKIHMKYYAFDGKDYKLVGEKGWDRIGNKSWSGS